MSDIFDGGIDRTIGRESDPTGGYTNDPDDNGGETIWGIEEEEARASGYTGPMKDMPRSWAVTIYRNKYVSDPQFDQLAEVDPMLALRLFDAGVNCGPQTASRWVQRALNVLNYGEDPYRDLDVDGNLFSRGRSAIRALYAKRGDDGKHVLLGMVIAQQAVGYMTIAEGNPTQKKFEYGWELQRAIAGVTFAST